MLCTQILQVFCLENVILYISNSHTYSLQAMREIHICTWLDIRVDMVGTNHNKLLTQ